MTLEQRCGVQIYHPDVLLAADRGKVTLLGFLDLSAAFGIIAL